MKPYSVDLLRTRIVRALQEEGTAKAAVARLFALSLSSVKRYAKGLPAEESPSSHEKGGARPLKTDERRHRSCSNRVCSLPSAWHRLLLPGHRHHLSPRIPQLQRRPRRAARRSRPAIQLSWRLWRGYRSASLHQPSRRLIEPALDASQLRDVSGVFRCFSTSSSTLWHT